MTENTKKQEIEEPKKEQPAVDIVKEKLKQAADEASPEYSKNADSPEGGE